MSTALYIMLTRDRPYPTLLKVVMVLDLLVTIPSAIRGVQILRQMIA